MHRATLLALLALAGCEGKAPIVATETAIAPAAVMPATPFQALGTEPFWAVEVLPGQMRYSDPENIAGTTFAATEAPDGQGIRYSGTLDGRPVSLLVEPGTCSDGMSDTVYRWQATLTIGARSEQGCARER